MKLVFVLVRSVVLALRGGAAKNNSSEIKVYISSSEPELKWCLD
jgi:hypothetical protein